MRKRIKIAMTGAAGQIGYALLFRIAAGEMFGSKAEIELNLLELPQALPALAGVVMELEDGAFPLLKSVKTTSVLSEAFEDVDWALLVGSVPRKAGMERKELLAINGRIFIEQGRALDTYAKKSCRVLVVGNPCNTNALIAKSVCKNIPAENFFAMTMLDQNRAVFQLAQKAGVNLWDIKRLAIWGNHSSTQYPDFYNAKIGRKPLTAVITDEQWLQTSFIEKIQKRGAEILVARGKSSAASAAEGVVQTVKRLVTSTPRGEFFSVAVSSDGSYGIPKGMMFSFPVVSNGKQWRIVQSIPLSIFAKEKIRVTLTELLEEKEQAQQAF
ncbi:MAG: malate dehydrogenase [Candidatus Omnitrophota bacterium]